MSRLLLAPSSLGSQSSFILSQRSFVELEGFSESNQQSLSGLNEGLESLDLLSKGVLLLNEVVKEVGPILLGLNLSLSGNALLFNKSGSDIVEEGEDLHDVLVVQLSGQLGQRSDEGLEQRSVFALVISQLLQDLVVSGLNLSEGNSVDHVVDQLDSLFQSGNRDRVLVVFLSPSGVLSSSLGSSSLDGLDGFIEILLSLSQIDLSLGQDIFVVSNGSLEGGDGILVLSDLLLQSSDGLVTGGLVRSVLLVSRLLVSIDLAQDLINQKGDLFEGGLDGDVHGDSRQNGLSELILVHFSENGLSIKDGGSLVGSSHRDSS